MVHARRGRNLLHQGNSAQWVSPRLYNGRRSRRLPPCPKRICRSQLLCPSWYSTWQACSSTSQGRSPSSARHPGRVGCGIHLENCGSTSIQCCGDAPAKHTVTPFRRGCSRHFLGGVDSSVPEWGTRCWCIVLSTFNCARSRGISVSPCAHCRHSRHNAAGGWWCT